MAEYDNTDRGVLFKNDRKETDKHPDYTGNIDVGGVEYWLSAWIKSGQKGKFMSLSIKIKDDAKSVQKREDAPPSRPPQRPQRPSYDDSDPGNPF